MKMKNFLCKIGLHKWKFLTVKIDDGYYDYRLCNTCGKCQYFCAGTMINVTKKRHIDRIIELGKE
jgi:Pyruvate/2-oxoacid:ferredoxin oxidoreductase delta subunit